MPGTGHFDKAAKDWDQEDRRVALARAVAAAMRSQASLTRSDSVLDFGCGTGLVTLELAPLAGSITGADTSPGMLAALAAKAPIPRIQLEPDGDGDLGGPYDLIVSSMTLHHVFDVPDLFLRLGRHLKPGGRVALADLDVEDGSFHGGADGVFHLGFQRDRVAAWLREAGFREVRVETACTTTKEGRDYSIFLALGIKD
ncbi:class I SAM-dependent DNA methyltransferase [Mesoterricola silvestris]|uniref:Methyltransferase n=1 Tax=Mesoterricola silvestris TaxID=2927979 RepID=A0AA48KBS0_9BACT|nr:class I SAM-dependent methyltransferase [Mesoterricola silvestris]BDU72788.1 methyltransferase [Mesoterricola silvestris]